MVLQVSSLTARMVGVFPFIFNQLDIKGNGTERIPDFMSDLRSESPDRGQPLRLNEPPLHGPQIRALLKHVNIAGTLPIADTLQGQ